MRGLRVLVPMANSWCSPFVIARTVQAVAICTTVTGTQILVGKHRSRFQEINTGRWESQPSLGPDGRTIYFVRASNPMETDRDIFVSTKDDEGNWTKGQRLPKNINSSDKESCPFMHFDGKTLYFLSERSPSLGSSDFFKSTRINDSTWSDPINLGFPFNSFGEEFSLVIDKSGKFGYLASDRGEATVPSYDGLSSLDLYRFDLPKHLQPENRDNYDLVIVDSLTLRPIGDAFVQLFNLDGVQFYSGTSAKNTGMVRLMTDGGEVRLSVYHKGYLPYSERYFSARLHRQTIAWEQRGNHQAHSNCFRQGISRYETFCSNWTKALYCLKVKRNSRRYYRCLRTIQT